MTKTKSPWPWACGIVLASAVAVLGHGGATGIVGERMMGMMMLGEQVKLLAPVANGGTVDQDVIEAAAEMIAMHGGRAMTDLFPEGSLDAPTEARPEIWARWQEFSDLADRIADLGVELGAAAATETVSVVPDTPAPVTAAVPPTSEWDGMSFASLMGIVPVRLEPQVDPVVTASIPADPRTRPVADIYADITATCSSCHASFRQ